MQVLRNRFLFLLLVFLFSCEPVVTFEEPQPVSIPKLNAFPDRLLGEYLSVNDSSFLIITEKSIFRKYDFSFPLDSNVLGKKFKIKGDSLLNLETKERFLIGERNKHPFIQVQGMDTLFSLSHTNVLKKFKGQYFLNTWYKEKGWAVESIRFSRDGLTMSQISPEKDVAEIRKIKNLSPDSLSLYQVDFSKKDFKQFIKKKGFSVHEKFIQIK